MLTFNRILESESIDPRVVHLIRNKDQRCNPHSTPYDAWLANDGTLDDYQRLQRKKSFRVGNLLANFVVTPNDETLFVGLYTVDDVGDAPRGMIDPLLDIDVSDMNLYEITPDPRLDRYSGRLVIDWGPGKRAFIQWADRREKPVIEVRD